jgi:hypothetical protein
VNKTASVVENCSKFEVHLLCEFLPPKNNKQQNCETLKKLAEAIEQRDQDDKLLSENSA